jgi:hypothetical protein
VPAVFAAAGGTHDDDEYDRAGRPAPHDRLVSIDRA